MELFQFQVLFNAINHGTTASVNAEVIHSALEVGHIWRGLRHTKRLIRNNTPLHAHRTYHLSQAIQKAFRASVIFRRVRNIASFLNIKASLLSDPAGKAATSNGNQHLGLLTQRQDLGSASKRVMEERLTGEVLRTPVVSGSSQEPDQQSW